MPGYRAGECLHTGAGLSLLRTGVTIGDFSGGGTASAGNLAEVTWGVGAGQGWLWGGECGGSRLVDSEKSSIVTLSTVCGAGWADRERTFATRTAFSRKSLGCGLSHLRENAVLARYRSSRCAGAAGCTALAPPELSAMLPWAGASRGGWLAMQRACRRSPAVRGMDRPVLRLSQSDSRLGAIELTEPDSTTILSAYDST